MFIKHFVMVSEIELVSVFGYCPYSITFPYVYLINHIIYLIKRF